jgi:hypothetical protein
LNQTLGENLKRVKAEIEKAAEVVLSTSGTEALQATCNTDQSQRIE